MNLAKSHLGRIHAALQALVVPPSCAVCRNWCDGELAIPLCADCQTEMPSAEFARCTRCSARIPGRNLSGKLLPGCRHCHQLDLPLASAFCIGNYEEPLRSLVRRMKVRGHESLALRLGAWLGSLWVEERGADPASTPHLLVPMPSHWTRRLARGCNLARLVGEGFLRSMDRPLPLRNALACVRPTRKQGTLTTPQRFENVKGCFSVRRKLLMPGQRVLLIDDVMTSGATVCQAARVLLQSGAGEVHFAFIARGTGGTL